MKSQDDKSNLTSFDESSPGLCGVLVLDKAEGLTSMDAVAIVRRKAARGKPRRLRVGHAGTLDPLATGVLVIAIGRATKLIDKLMAGRKQYETIIDLSAFTTADDREGERQEVATQSIPTFEQVEEALAQFRGTFQQRPPSFSAIKIKGRRAYELARQGVSVQTQARPVTVHAMEITSYEWPRLALRINCAKGFYVRSLARELGAALKTGGHCLLIRRTAVGPFDLAMARQLEQLPEQLAASDLMTIEDALNLLKPSR